MESKSPEISAHLVIDFMAVDEIHNTEQAESMCLQAFCRMQQFAKQNPENRSYLLIGRQDGSLGLSYVTNPQAMTGGLSALIKTAALECPGSHFKYIDIGHSLSHTAFASLIHQESLADFKNKEIAFPSENQRVTLTLAPYQKQERISRLSLNKESVILVTGGGRGVTAACIIELAKTVPATFILIGRSELQNESASYHNCPNEAELKKLLIAESFASQQKMTPKEIEAKLKQIIDNREIISTLNQLTKLNARAEYHSVNVNDKNAVHQLIEQLLHQYQKIDGLIHGAGILADKLLVEKSTEQFCTVFNTKINGLNNLLSAISIEQLKLLVFFSSVAARFGNIGQVDYALANECLNKMAQAYKRQCPNCSVKAINWGPWAGGMVNKSLQKVFEERGIHLIPIKDGAQAFVRCILEKNEAVELVIGSALQEQTANVPKMTIDDPLILNTQTLPYLTSHVIRNKLVIPCVQVLEWFYEYALLHHLFDRKVCLDNFRVLKGIMFDDPQETQKFLIKYNKERNKLSLCNMESNRINYTADIGVYKPIDTPIFPKELLKASGYPGQSAYQDKRAFHGPAFHNIDEFVFGDSQDSLAKITLPKSTYMYTTLLDSAMQLMSFWCIGFFNTPILPMYAQKVLFLAENKTVPLHSFCYLTKLKHDSLKTTGNAYFYDNNYHVFMIIENIHMYAINGNYNGAE